MCQQAAEARRRDKPLGALLARYLGESAPLLERPEDHRLQVLVTEVLDVAGGPCVVEHTYRAGAEYFYPASAIKTVASVVSLKAAAEVGLTFDTPLTFGTTSATDAQTLRELVEETQIVSNNDTFNRLYELAGHARMNQMFWDAGFDSLRMQHRMFSKRTPDEERLVPAVYRCRGEDCSAPVFRERTSALPMPPIAHARPTVGSSYKDLITGQLVEGPMDFSGKNAMSLRDHQRLTIAIVAPDLAQTKALGLNEPARALLLEVMERDPAGYEPALGDGARRRFKPMSPGLEAAGAREVRYLNKAGRALGFHVENAALVRGSLEKPERLVFVAAAVYVNEDGRLNDDRYEYDTLSFPFFAELGTLVAREFL